MYQAGADVNMMRHAEEDGLRIVAWLAQHMEPGADPLKTIVQMAIDAGWDVDPVDAEWAESDVEDEPAEDDEMAEESA